ncbi:34727_t:CDS:2 [Gigaspora margarita]|uniref:34727_t:CDS:1 n=1 Tax=Gigaspora margarita TaxID=4874 RepID=A0ABN7V8F8_GIGMA|nr:34727_t:CDS:2 [Gigaspora margarita]
MRPCLPYFIIINAKGSKFFIHRDYIKKYPETFLYVLINFNDMKYEQKDYVDESDYEIDVDYEPYIFCHIHSYYINGRYPQKYNKKILEVFDYFLIKLPDRRWEGMSSYLYRKSKLNCYRGCKCKYNLCFCGKQKFIDDKFCYSCIESERKLLEYCNDRKRYK